MKKTILIVGIFLSATVQFSGQTTVKSIENKNNQLVVNDTIALTKGSIIQIYLPAGHDYVFIKQKKQFNAKLLGKVADLVGTGAATVGMGSENLKVLTGASEVMRKANAVQYGANAIGKIQDLPISNDAKKIAGKKIEIQGWEFTSDGYVLTGLLDKKKYEIYLQEALIAGEIKL